MSSRQRKKLYLCEDDIARIPRAIVGDIRHIISPIISNDYDSQLSLTEVFFTVTNPTSQRHPDMKYLEDRIKSFQDNTRYDNFPNEAAKAGFFCTGENDSLHCFECGVGVHCWKVTDDPWIRHAEFSPFCPHLKRWKTITWKNGMPVRIRVRQRFLSSETS